MISKESYRPESSGSGLSLRLGFAVPGRTPWPDEPFSLPDVPLPPKPGNSLGSLQRAVEISWHRLDARLNDPVRVEHTPKRTRLWVLDIAYFEVDQELRLVRGGIVQRSGQLRLSHTIDLGNPLADAEWFMGLSDRIFDGWPEDERFHLPIPNGNVRARRAAMKRLWDRLVSDKRFHSAIQWAVPHELGLDADVWRLAIATSIGWEGLTASEYETVWRNLPAFRQVEAENPDLLPLLPVYLTCHDDRFEGDPILSIKEWFRTRGLSDAAWRYLARVGTGPFAPVLRRVRPEARLIGLLRFLKLVEKMEFDTNLGDLVLEAWLDVMCGDSRWLSLRENWFAIHPSILRVAFGASRDIGAWVAEGRHRELPHVLAWAKLTGLELSKSQIRAGWGSLARRWRKESPRDAEEAAGFRYEWKAPTGRVELGDWYAEPLCSAADLRLEAEAMRNCLSNDHYFRDCLRGRLAVYSIRRAFGNESTASAAFVRRGSSPWALIEAKGPGNAAVDSETLKQVLRLQALIRRQATCVANEEAT